MSTTAWQAYSEPLRTTLIRTIAIAVVMGLAVSFSVGAGVSRWPAATVLMLWPSFGGHWVELWFLNWLRPRLSLARGVQLAARVAVWFAGGIILGIGMYATALMVKTLRPPHWPAWWVAGVGFIGVELVAQLALQLRGRPSFYNGRG
jgi:hypothetical protein